MQKICLIKAPDKDAKDPCMDAPLSLLYIASALLQENFEVEILDCGSEMPTNFPAADIYGITCGTANLKESYRTAARLRSQFSKARILGGGSHANVLPQSINQTNFDAIIVGECEINIGKLITEGKGICQGIPPTEIDYLHPLPWHLIQMENYLGRRGISSRSATIMTSRGCPYRCRFCLNGNPCFSKSYRWISPDSLARDLEIFKKKYSVDGLLVVDDYLVFEKYLPILADFPWWCLATINQLAQEGNAKKMREANCVGVRLGIESGSAKMLKLFRKPQTLKTIHLAVSNAKTAGLQIHAFVFIGFPGESWETIYETEELIRKLEIDAVRLNVFTPYPGTLPYHFPEQFGITWLSSEWSDYRAKNKYGERIPCFETKSLSQEELTKMTIYLLEVIKSEGYEVF